MENIKKIIPKLVGKKILVFGDLMLDEHIWSRVSRISPEAPVPIADVARISHVPGGCGNVAANIASLKAKPYLVSVIGKDSSGQKLCKSLSDKGISTGHLVIDPKRPTILKSRIIAGSQHMVRVDREDRTVLSPKLLASITKRLKKLIPKMDGVIISDYAKGSVTAKTAQLIISLAKAYSQILAYTGASRGLLNFALGLDLAPLMIVAAIQMVAIILGMFMTTGGIIMILIPIVVPIVEALDFNLVWFCVMFLINMEIAHISPPYGVSLFIMHSVAPPGTTLGDVFRAALPFIGLCILAMTLILFFPQIALWLPSVL